MNETSHVAARRVAAGATRLHIRRCVHRQGRTAAAYSGGHRQTKRAARSAAAGDDARHDASDADTDNQAFVDEDEPGTLTMPRSAELDAFVKAVRDREEREGVSGASPLLKGDPSVVPAPVYTPSIQGVPQPR